MDEMIEFGKKMKDEINTQIWSFYNDIKQAALGEESRHGDEPVRTRPAKSKSSRT
ncbi:hypothetical protein CANCADRAFT_32143 [Tortispora caseinolytica NRRL Y-17796]|uniref:DUF4048 domain-containing protein n=1 Tax=Tortispora caseinolytica NRRL Y-17796 TaxID=767744 RepID=A0A1E4TA23_9ASCO|nr:hypothetical protein CANCADRAFT_32143 [Tortispora caseinolytica NRRL Y-17796]